MKAQSPLLGFNNNVRHKGRVFHIQTEDSGIKHPHVITHLFADGGRIVRSQKTSYAEHVGDEEMQRKVRALMQEQHKAMFIALRAGKFDHLLEGIPTAEPSHQGHRPPMESTISIEIGTPSDPGGVVHVAPGASPVAPKGLTPPPSPAVAAPAPPASPAVAPAPAPSSPGPASSSAPKSVPTKLESAPTLLAQKAVQPIAPTAPAIPAAAPAPAAPAPQAAPPKVRLTPPPPQRAAAPAPVPVAAARPPSIIPPAAKPLAPASVPPPPMDVGAAAGQRPPIRKNSGLLAALGALSAGNKAPSLGASPPSSRQAPVSARAQGNAAAAPSRTPSPPVGRPPAPSSLDLDLEALERAAEQGNSPVYRQVRDFPPPPQAVRTSGAPSMRSLTPQPTSTIPQQDRPGNAAAAAGGAGRYAPSRPASIFGSAKPQEGSSIFGEDLISEKSLDEVILSYLAEDLEPPPKK